MNKETLILFSGGKDSFLSTLITIDRGYKVNLITYENGCGLKSNNALHGARRILKRYGEDKVNIIGISKIEVIWREFINLYYNNKLSENIKKYGDITISQFNCLSCRLAMYVMSIIIAKQKNIKLVVDGARKSQLFAIEQEKLLEKFKKFFKANGLELDFPIKNLENDFELKNELLIRGFVPKTIEPQCLLGLPLKKEQIDDEIINSTANIFDKLLKSKAQELIDKYKDIDFIGEYI